MGYAQIAERLGVGVGTVKQWRSRGTRAGDPPFPEPSFTVGLQPVFDWREVRAWAKETERL